MAVADFTTAYAALGLGFARGKRGEVVVEEEPLVVLAQYVVDEFLVELGSERAGGQRKGLSALEECASMGHGQWRHLAPDGAYFVGGATVEAQSFVEDAAAHHVAHHVFVVACGLGVLLFALVVGEFGVLGVVFLQEVGQQFVERVVACVLLQGLVVDVVGGLVELFLDLVAELFVVHLVVVVAFLVGAQFLGQLVLQRAHGLDGLVGGLERADEVKFRHFLHLAFHHHDVVFGGADHEVHVGVGHLLEGRVDDVFAVDACHAHF